MRNIPDLVKEENEQDKQTYYGVNSVDLIVDQSDRSRTGVLEKGPFLAGVLGLKETALVFVLGVFIVLLCVLSTIFVASLLPIVAIFVGISWIIKLIAEWIYKYE